jgi:hypothetical protein
MLLALARREIAGAARVHGSLWRPPAPPLAREWDPRRLGLRLVFGLLVGEVEVVFDVGEAEFVVVEALGVVAFEEVGDGLAEELGGGGVGVGGELAEGFPVVVGEVDGALCHGGDGGWLSLVCLGGLWPWWLIGWLIGYRLDGWWRVGAFVLVMWAFLYVDVLTMEGQGVGDLVVFRGGGLWRSSGWIALRFGVSVRTVERWRAAGCPALRAGGVVRFREVEVEGWLRGRGLVGRVAARKG